MPFTASHPAAVLPLRRLGLPMTGLVVGSRRWLRGGVVVGAVLAVVVVALPRLSHGLRAAEYDVLRHGGAPVVGVVLVAATIWHGLHSRTTGGAQR